MEILNEVDTKDVEPTAHIGGLTNVMSEDQLKEQGIRKFDSEEYRDELLKNAPQVQDGFIKVPPVLE
jgi:aspartyl-tRNA(Asn)/glutamyl-tRNA(Gln) amidotransferase subunit C